MGEVSKEYIDARFDALEKRMDKIEDALRGVARMEANQDNSYQGMQRMGTKLDSLETRLVGVERDQARREIPNSWADKLMWGLSGGAILAVVYSFIQGKIP